MRLLVFGLSVTSSWGNGHATTYRALLGAAAARGHEVTFYEWDAPWYGGGHRDLPDPGFCRLRLYDRWADVRAEAFRAAEAADAVIVGSCVHDGPTIIDDLAAADASPLFFYDIDTPVTVAQLRRGETISLRPDQVPLFTRYLSFTGGPFLHDVIERELGAREAQPLYCAVDDRHYRPVPPDPGLGADLAYMGTYAEDRQPALERLLMEPARRLPGRAFIVAGPQYPPGLRWPSNVRRLDHVPPARHPSFYSSAAWQLNLTRSDMRAAGWSPSVRLFEAAACGAAIISDQWPGLDEFLVPGRELLVVDRTDDVVEILTATAATERQRIAQAARERILREHTASRRALELESLLEPTVTA